MVIRLLALLLAMASPAAAQETLPPEQARIEIVLDDPGAVLFEKQMALATIRGFYSVNITLEELTVPRILEVDWVQLARDRWTAQRIGGRSLRVMERRIAFFPQRAGEVRIPPVVHALQIRALDGERTEHLVRSDPVMLTVKPALAGQGDWWLPPQDLEYTDEWSRDPGVLTDGDSVERTVTLSVLGATPQMLPPQPPMRAPWLITITAPEERRMELTPLGPLTTLVWRWTLRPKTGEPGVLPEVRIPWLDLPEGQPRQAVLEAAPFGYASFSDNARIRWRSGFGRVWIAGAGVLAGVLLALLLLAPGARLRAKSEIRAWGRRLLPDPDSRALRRAARRGDARAFRAAAARLLKARGVSEQARLSLTRSLDERLFGEAAGEAQDLKRLAQEIQKQRISASA